MEETFPDVGSMSDEELKSTDRLAQGRGARGLLPSPPPARQDRHPARRAGQPPEGQARGRRRADQRRRRPGAHRHPAGQGRARRRTGRRCVDGASTVQSAGSSTPRARTTARSAARTSAAPRASERRLDDDLQGRRDRRVPAGRHRGGGRQAGAALVIRSGGGRAGESFTVDGERMSIGRTPDAGVFLDDVTVSRNHALRRPPPGRPLHRRPRLAERHLREPPPDRVAQARGRRRDPDRQVQAELPGALRMAVATQGRGRAEARAPRFALAARARR